MRTGKCRVINRDKVKLVDPDLEWSDVRQRPNGTARRPINVPAPAPPAKLRADQQPENTAARNPQPLKRRRTDSLDSYVSPPGVRRSQRLAEKNTVFQCPDLDTEGEGSGYLPRNLPQKRTRESGDYGEAKRRCFESSQYWSVWTPSAQQISSLRMVSTSREKAPQESLSRYGLPWSSSTPPPTIPMRAWVEEVRAGIQTVGSRTTAEDQKIWETRLEALLRLTGKAGEAVLDRTSRSLERRRRRVKRGLVDIIGEAGKALFGVATQRDVTDIRRAVKQAEKDTAIVYHRTDKMLSVINQTRKYVRENRKDIEQLQQHQQALQTRLLEYGDHLSQLDIQVDRLTVARLIDNLIAQLELIAEEFQQQWRIFRQQKHELERGWLTESTLAPTELESMLRKLRSQGYYTPRAE